MKQQQLSDLACNTMVILTKDLQEALYLLRYKVYDEYAVVDACMKLNDGCIDGCCYYHLLVSAYLLQKIFVLSLGTLVASNCLLRP